jgi:hypothetical protein
LADHFVVEDDREEIKKILARLGFASIIKEPRESDRSCIQGTSIFEHRKHPPFPAHGRDILAFSQIVAFVDMLHAAGCIGLPIARRAHISNPMSQLGVNLASRRRYPLFLNHHASA